MLQNDCSSFSETRRADYVLFLQNSWVVHSHSEISLKSKFRQAPNIRYISDVISNQDIERAPELKR